MNPSGKFIQVRIRINQEPNETVLEYANNVTEMGNKILQLKTLEPGITEENLTTFKTKLETDIPRDSNYPDTGFSPKKIAKRLEKR